MTYVTNGKHRDYGIGYAKGFEDGVKAAMERVAERRAEADQKVMAQLPRWMLWRWLRWREAVAAHDALSRLDFADLAESQRLPYVSRELENTSFPCCQKCGAPLSHHGTECVRYDKNGQLVNGSRIAGERG